MLETLQIRADGRGVARLILNRPERHNAMSARMIAELAEAAAALGADPAIRVVVLEGAGASFCAGADLGWMREQVEADAATRAEGARSLASMLGALNTLPKPLIGRVNGNAFGGGVGLISVCDMAIAAAGARFALSETRLGLLPATIGPYLLARIGEPAARRFALSAKGFGTDEAREIGLLAHVVPEAGLDGAIEAEIAAFLACAPGAVAEAKALFRALGPEIRAAQIEASVAALLAQWESPEATEGLAAFFAKRKPKWVSEP